jgi:hypothetical protein
MLVDLDEDQVAFLRTLGGISDDVTAKRPTRPPEGWNEERALKTLSNLLFKLKEPLDWKDACMDRLNQLASKIIDKSEGKTSVDESFLSPKERKEWRIIRTALVRIAKVI